LRSTTSVVCGGQRSCDCGSRLGERKWQGWREYGGQSRMNLECRLGGEYSTGKVLSVLTA